MAGTLFGLGLSQQFDANGDPMAGCLLYIYQANSSTPVTSYRNVALTAGQEHPWPIVADANGRIPAFWLADGSYRARLTDAAGNPQFDEANMLALGPSSGGGGGGDTTDPNSVASTGDVKWRLVTGIELPGWVRMYGGTLGSLTSGANYAGASATHQPLFLFLWNNLTEVTNVFLPVLPSRGADALSDWNANKRITIPDMRSRSPFGLDDMGGAAANRLTGTTFNPLGTSIKPGSSGGTDAVGLSTAQLPAHQHDAFIGDDGHDHNMESNSSDVGATVLAMRPGISGGQFGAAGTDSGTYTLGIRPASTGVKVRSTAGNAATADNKTASTGTGASHANMTPFMLGTWFMRL